MHPLLWVLAALAAAAGALALALVFGGPAQPAPMASFNEPFRRVDFSDLPAASRYSARDGARLAYRVYPAAGEARGGVVLVHGSAASGATLHVLAKGLAAAGFAAYALDIRGHGDSGRRGQIGYVGQLEDDLEDFLGAVRPPRPTTLAGFSAGGGFALRFAGSARQKLFSSYLLLSPFLSAASPTFRPGAGGWVRLGLARIIAITLLDAIGVRACNGLTVFRFALDGEARELLTPAYSFALARNFQPHWDYRADLRAAGQPLSLIAGREDEVFHAERYAAAFQSAGKDIPVTLLPGLGHVALTLDPAAVRAAVAGVEAMAP